MDDGRQRAPRAKVAKFAALFDDSAPVDKARGDADPDAPMRFVASDESRDRYGDIIRQSGWDLTAFKRNPVALFGHKHDEIIGKISHVAVEGKKLMTELSLAEAGTGPVVDYVRALVRQKLLKAVSVSFLPLDWQYLRDEKKDEVIGYEFLKQELLEISLVSVPANAQALELARSLGLSDSLRKSLLVPVDRGLHELQRARFELETLRVRREESGAE